MEDIFSNLNDSQISAVSHTEGPSLVIAGAGSGKTRVLTYKIAYLLSQNVRAWNILALTFTNKAAAEMKDRITKLVGEETARGLYMGTFHSIFAKILRIEVQSLPGYTSAFTILDTDDVKKLLTDIVKRLLLDKDTYKAAKLIGIISKAKNDLITAEMYESADMRKYDAQNGMPEVYRIYAEYEKACKQSNAMDFDDLLLKTNILFRDNPSVLEKYQSLFKYILVDEYQDTNTCQYHIIKKLALPNNNLCVVGDDAQSIYSFRGARIENILNFQKDYKDCKLFKLEQNYRSTQTIVNAANSLIKKNSKQIAKTIFSENNVGEKINLLETPTDAEEGLRIASLIASLIDKGENYNDCAILYRTNAQSRIIEEALNKKRIPCKIVKGMSFFQRKDVKDVLAYVRTIVNPHDELALERIINYPARSIGDTTVTKLKQVATAYNLTLWDVLVQIDKLESIISAATRNKITNFVTLIQSFIADRDEADAYSLLNRIVEKINFKEVIDKEYEKEEAKERFDNILELLNGAKEFVEDEIDPESIYLHNYLEKIALLTDIDEEETENPNKVLLMTIHAAKGLEFKHCFLVGLEENVFPSQMSMDTPQNIEEERRLFYVAITRAMKTVTISYALTRRKFGTLTNSQPSRFLSEIDETYMNGRPRKTISYSTQTSSTNNFSNFGKQRSAFSNFSQPKSNAFASFSRPQPNAMSSFGNTKQTEAFAHFGEKPKEPTLITPSKTEDIQEGLRVYHAKFGFGTVKQRPDSDAAIITFDNWGEKKLLLKFANLQIVEN
ncbi:MAG: UvrD-helicase domain-containing protein [Bacteroidales bacterium]|nr:UvrD-helicase domain-containing protein [Bacteroidales bacterium]